METKLNFKRRKAIKTVLVKRVHGSTQCNKHFKIMRLIICDILMKGKTSYETVVLRWCWYNEIIKFGRQSC